MQLYFIRHGQSENNLLWARTGSSEGRVADPALTEVGRRQAALVAAFLARARSRDVSRLGEGTVDWDLQNTYGFPITHCYCSLMERAVETGHAIAEALDLPLLGWIEIHETGGMYIRDAETGEALARPGRVRSYLEEHYPRIVLPEAATEEGWWNRPLEPDEARQPRADAVVRELLEKHGGTNDGVVFVSHGGFYNHLLRAILGLDISDDRWFAANNTSITRIDFRGDARVVAYQNRVDFLTPDLIT